MNKKLRIIISVILFLVTIAITTSSVQAGLVIPTSGHWDTWTGRNQFFAYKYKTEGDEGKTAKFTTICADKMGALRFTPVGLRSTLSNLSHNYDGDTIENIEDEYEIHMDCSLAVDGGTGSTFVTLRNLMKGKITTKIQSFAGSWANATRTGDYYDYYNGSYNVTQIAENTTYGLNEEIVAVSNPFCMTANYTPSGSQVTKKNCVVSYILSAGSYAHPTNFGLKQGNYNESTISTQENVDPGLIQGALWNTDSDTFNVGIQQNYGGTIKELYDEAYDYEDYYDDELKDYEASIDGTKAQVIVDRANKKYTVGPYKITYPDDTRFSYVQDIYVKIKDGARIVTKEPTIICKSGDYPLSGKSFFVQFSADGLENPTKVSVGVNFAYLENTTAKYQKYAAEAQPIYQLVGIRKCEHTTHEYEYTSGWEEVENEETGELEEVEIKSTGNCDIYTYTGRIVVKKVGTYHSQVLVDVTDVSRTWKPCNKETDIEDGPSLTMELGGRVFFDSDLGKISEVNGLYDKDKDKLMPNVIVTLYRGDNGKLIGTTKTLNEDTDINGDGDTNEPYEKKGSYYFTGLNAMYQYYVKFTYNGQYYEPTTYASKSTWGDEKWKTNSNGTDRTEEREELNAKFKTIESSPRNYSYEENKYNETYTKDELLGKTLNTEGKYEVTKTPVIDEFGNLILTKSEVNKMSKSDAEKQELKNKIQYVEDCLMSSYTSSQQNATVQNNGRDSMDLYPTIDKFVISDSPIVDRNILGTGFGTIKLLYKDAYYINQGLSARHQADVALVKDVQKVTLEINGQTQEYKYKDVNAHCKSHNWEGTYEKVQLVYNGELGQNIKLCPNCIKQLNENNIDPRTWRPEGICEFETVWDIDMRISDGNYYNKVYKRDIYKSDYLYDVENAYGTDDYERTYGKSTNDELRVFITYRLDVHNQSMSIETKIEEIVDYYDEDLIYEPSRSYIQIGDKKYEVNCGSESKYEARECKTQIDGYSNLYITKIKYSENKQELEDILNDGYFDAGEIVSIYLTFEVKKDEQGRIILDQDIIEKDGKIVYENKTGKENIAEINGYSTRYEEGITIPNIGNVEKKVAGLVDRDSKPGNLKADYIEGNRIQYEKFEDDNDKAPNMGIRLYGEEENERIISGVVWEDARTKTNETLKTTTGDGKRNEETLINGVTVQLVELMDNGTEYVWREFGDNAGNGGGINTIGKGTGSGTRNTETPIINEKVGVINLVKDYDFGDNYKGAYAFKSFVPGKYVIRFIYGDTIRTVAPESLGGLNEKSYNGQDYKSTAYQSGVTTNAEYLWYKVTERNMDNITRITTYATVPTYNKNDCDENETVVRNGTKNGYLHDIKTLEEYADVSDAKDIERIRNNVNNYSDDNITNYIAEVLASHKNDYDTMNNRENLLNELMTNTKMTAETGLMVIEFEKAETTSDGKKDTASYHIENIDLGLEERPKAQLTVDKEITNAKITLANGTTLFDAQGVETNVLWKDHEQYNTGYTDKYTMDLEKFGNIENIRNKNASKFGLIQFSMDEELMHGAKIELTYQITVKNVGEVDYKDNKFYYTGDGVLDNNSIVTTSANQVIDYVANNLQFNKSINDNWNTIELGNVIKEQDARTSLVHANLKTELEKYNTIITTESLNKALKPAILGESESTTSTPLILTQLITTENDTDDLTYVNMVEIVKTSNTVGRRMEYSVVGNQNPSEEPQEIDSDRAEKVKVLPPFGNAGIYIIIAIITIAAVGIIITGIIFIKKKVLTK